MTAFVQAHIIVHLIRRINFNMHNVKKISQQSGMLVQMQTDKCTELYYKLSVTGVPVNNSAIIFTCLRLG